MALIGIDLFLSFSAPLFNMINRTTVSEVLGNQIKDTRAEDNDIDSRPKLFYFPTTADLKGARGSADGCGDPLYSSRAILINSYSNKFPFWLSLLDFNYSLFFYGIGARHLILNNFVQTTLSGEDVLQIDCEKHASDHRGGWKALIMNVLRTVTETILGPAVGAGGVQRQLQRAVSLAMASVNDENMSLIGRTKAISGIIWYIK